MTALIPRRTRITDEKRRALGLSRIVRGHYVAQRQRPAKVQHPKAP